VEQDVDEVHQHGDADHEEEDGGEHDSFLGSPAGRPAAVDRALTALDAFLTGPPLESES
jgi:hypothetical protein